MVKDAPQFGRYAARYDRWFEENPELYHAELQLLRHFLRDGRGLEVGVGSGRFASELSIRYGLDPSLEMLEYARRRSICVILGVGEALPFASQSFAVTLMTTTVCFLDDIRQAFDELFRVLQLGGRTVIGLIDGNSWLGQYYRDKAEGNVLYREARFHGPGEVADQLCEAGFRKIQFSQTLFQMDESGSIGSDIKKGYGQGGYVVVCAEKVGEREYDA